MDPRTHPFARRSQGAFLGLALGDAYGRPLEFIRSPAVRHHPVDTRHLRWTDDTHMALYLARAIASVDEFDPEHFGRAWREQVIAWSDDPLTPSTAPGNTCLTGAARAKQGLSWRDCGVVHSDGCGAVMRVAALPMRWRGSSLDEAARISAMVTHGHPNAIYSTITLCRILRDLLEGAPLGADTIRRHAERSRRVRLRHSEKALDHSEVDLDGATPFFGKGLVAGLPSREQVYAHAVRRGHVCSLPWHACGGAA